jgi:amino acid adenylation domain-containing protein
MEKFIPDTKFQPVDFDPFAGPAIERTAPSTEAQREVWVASQMGVEASCAYIESVSLELVGAVDAALMERTIRQLVERHEGLRSVISADGMRVIVQETMEVPFTFTDLSGKNDAERTKELQNIADRDMTLPFELLTGPLFRVQLIKTRNDTHLLRLSGHHVIVDGWSLGIIMADVSRLYSALQESRAPVLPEVFRFSDFAIAQLDFAKSPELAPIEGYWKDLFKGHLPHLELPADRVRPKAKTFKGKRLDMELEKELVLSLRELATRSGASFVTTLLTSFELLIYRLTGDSDMCVGLPSAGQSDFGMKDLVGHCVNLLALRSQIDENTPFVDHLKARRTAVLDAFDNQRYAFGTLVRTLKVPREAGRVPLCPVVFNIDMNMDDGVDFADLKHRFISNPRKYENFELFLNATGSDEGLTLEWSYNTDLFDDSSVRRWMQEFIALIKRICGQPSALIGDLVGDEEIGALPEYPPVEWYGKSLAYPRDKSVNQLFDEVVAQYPDKVALNHRDKELSYAQLHQRVIALTALLKEHGVKPGDFVGLCCERNFGMVEAQLAIMRAGAAFVPLDHTYPADRLRFLFEDTRLKVLLTEKELNAKLPKHDARVIQLDGERSKAVNAAEHAPLDTPEAAAYIMYTSGSTGKPKGVVVPHRGIVRLVKNQNYAPFGPDAVITQMSNVSFDASTFELWGALLNGGRLVLQPQAKPTLAEVTETMERYGVNILFITTGLFNVLVDEHVDRLKGLKCILTGGEVMSLPHIRKALRVLGPGVLNNIYGPTENTTYSCFHPINSEGDIGKQVPIGKAIHNTFLYVLDEQQKPVPVGAKGELYCGGDGVALGYWERPELTEERFLPDPFRGGNAKMYRSGDLVKWLPDGSIEFLGRADDQVKIRGFRIELGEIENAISNYPGVRDRLVMARKDMPGGQQLVAYVVPNDFDPSKDEAKQEAFIAGLRNHLEEALPKFMLPSFFVALSELPLNPNGKVDKKVLPVPELRSTRMKAEHVSARNAIEKTLSTIWGKALGVEDLGVHDNFFDLGGHSIMGIQMLTQVEQQLSRKLALNSLFQAPTVALFAELIKKDEKPLDLLNLAPIQKEGNKLPLFCVHGDEANYFMSRDLGKDQPFWGFFHQGEDGHPLRYTEVEDIAAHFIRELKQVRPEGPYLLCGFSFGGMVAYEMAQQLKRDGDQVLMLALLDTYAPKLFGEVMQEEAKFYDPLKKAVMRSMVKWQHDKGKVLAPKLRHFNIIDTYDQATYRYDIKPYDGPVLMIKAAASPGPDHMGWKDLVKGELTLASTPGDHYNMIKDPHVKTLSKLIEHGIAQAVERAAVQAG